MFTLNIGNVTLVTLSTSVNTDLFNRMIKKKIQSEQLCGWKHVAVERSEENDLV